MGNLGTKEDVKIALTHAVEGEGVRREYFSLLPLQSRILLQRSDLECESEMQLPVGCEQCTIRRGWTAAEKAAISLQVSLCSSQPSRHP